MEVLKRLNHVETKLLIWGDPFSEESNEVIVCVTGNPGIIDFYYEFCSELNKNTELPICLIGHGGHEIIPAQKCYSLKDEGYLFDLKGQVEHKLDLINNHIPKTCKLHLIGHSIGAWMLLESIHKNPQVTERVASLNMLFPTLQEMAITKNGPFVNTIRKIHSLAIILLTVLNMLPDFLLNFIALLYLKFNKLPSHFTERILKYVNPVIIDKVLFLAYDEMDRVKTLNTEAVKKVKHLSYVIYSENDGWVPLTYIKDLEEFLPQQQMVMVPYSHAFVLKSSEKVAELVSIFIKHKSN